MKPRKFIAISAGCIWASGAAHAGQTVNYTYDALGRLTEVQSQSSSADGTTQIFHFDAAGNRTQYQLLKQVVLSMGSSVVNLTSTGADLRVNVNDPSATGTVTFTEGTTFLGSASVSNGVAAVILQGLTKGSHTITASYSGDGGHTPETVTFTVNVVNLSWLPAVLNLLLQN